jgi:hypothetical protein
MYMLGYAGKDKDKGKGKVLPARINIQSKEEY